MRMRNVGNLFLKSNKHKHVSIPQNAKWLPKAFKNRGGKIERKTEGETKQEKRGTLWEKGCSHNAKNRDVQPHRRL